MLRKKRNEFDRQLKPAAQKVLLKILLNNNHKPTATPSSVRKLLIKLKVKDQQ